MPKKTTKVAKLSKIPKKTTKVSKSNSKIFEITRVRNEEPTLCKKRPRNTNGEGKKREVIDLISDDEVIQPTNDEVKKNATISEDNQEINLNADDLKELYDLYEASMNTLIKDEVKKNATISEDNPEMNSDADDLGELYDICGPAIKTLTKDEEVDDDGDLDLGPEIYAEIAAFFEEDAKEKTNSKYQLRTDVIQGYVNVEKKIKQKKEQIKAIDEVLVAPGYECQSFVDKNREALIRERAILKNQICEIVREYEAPERLMSETLIFKDTDFPRSDFGDFFASELNSNNVRTLRQSVIGLLRHLHDKEKRSHMKKKYKSVFSSIFFSQDELKEGNSEKAKDKKRYYLFDRPTIEYLISTSVLSGFLVSGSISDGFEKNVNDTFTFLKHIAFMTVELNEEEKSLFSMCISPQEDDKCYLLKREAKFFWCTNCWSNDVLKKFMEVK